jgi:hypothetical protein
MYFYVPTPAATRDQIFVFRVIFKERPVIVSLGDVAITVYEIAATARVRLEPKTVQLQS